MENILVNANLSKKFEHNNQLTANILIKICIIAYKYA